MKLDDIAKNLANRVNQLHYVKWTLDKVAKTAYDKGFKDAQEQVKTLNIDNVSNQRELLIEYEKYTMGLDYFKAKPEIEEFLEIRNNL
jgi:hypothetical protein